MSVFELSMKLVILISIGYAARKLRIMADGFDKMLTRFVMALPLPCMIINSFQIEFSTKDLLNCPVLLGLALLSIGINWLFSQMVYRRMGKTGLARSVRFALTFTNFTFFGLPVVSELYGAQGVFYYVIFTLPMRVIFYGGAPMLVGEGQKLSVKETVKKFFSEPVVAVFIGFFIYVTQLPLPNVVTNTIQTLGNMASPLGLMLCGVIIADARWREVLKYPCVIWVSLLRLLVIPALALGLFLLLGVERDMLRPILYYFVMPVASLLPTFLLRYNPDELEGRVAGGYMVVASTLLCMATVPMWALILERL